MNWLEYLLGDLFILSHRPCESCFQNFSVYGETCFVNWWCIPWFFFTLLSNSIQCFTRVHVSSNETGCGTRWTASRTRSNLIWSPTFLASTILGIDNDIHTLETCRAWAWCVLIAWAGSNCVLASKDFLKDFLWHFPVDSLFCRNARSLWRSSDWWRIILNQKKLRRQKVTRVSVPLL